ncbi:MAG: hypothetical protein IT536_16695 [Hyphomicrobiales bacterium]|nr:hypothetical protein [Hyphomicrobiales bacterium]
MLDVAMQRLVKDKRLFGTLADKADTIEGAGNVLARGVNEARAADAAALADMLAKLAQRTGPVSDALNRASARQHEGHLTHSQAVDAFLEDVRTLLDREGLAGLMADPQLRPATVAEPGTPEALAVAEAGRAERASGQERSPPARQTEGAAPSLAEGDELTRAQPSLGVVSEQDIVNPIDRTASPQEKVRQLQTLSAQNRPIVDDLLQRIDREFGTESKSDEKLSKKIIEKASRPSILERKPWHRIEHIRDSFRFKTVLEDFALLPEILARVAAEGIEVIKRDIAKVLDPEIWGWRIVVFDLRMPNGQLVEYYLPVRELEAAKKAGNHRRFEKWRNKDWFHLTPAERAEMTVDQQASRELYQAAWEAFLARADVSESDVRAALNRVAASEASATGKKPSFSSPTVSDSFFQTPPTRMAEKPSEKSPTNTIEGSSRSVKASADIGRDIGVSAAESKVEPTLFSAVAVASREDGADTRFITRKQALDEADAPARHADLVASCKD